MGLRGEGAGFKGKMKQGWRSKGYGVSERERNGTRLIRQRELKWEKGVYVLWEKGDGVGGEIGAWSRERKRKGRRSR